MTSKKEYVLYTHTNLLSGKKYVGITKQPDPKMRWGRDGVGYASNKKFYDDILKYGWENFRHEIKYQNLDYKEALFLENKLMKKYDSVNNGYNVSYNNYGSLCNYDYYDFNPIATQDIEYKNNNTFFSRIPNSLIRCNMQTDYKLHRIFFVVWITIDRHRTLEDLSYITIQEILTVCGYKCTQPKPKIFHEVVKCLLFLDSCKFIEIDPLDLYDISYTKNITLKIIAPNFDQPNNFTRIYNTEIDSILLFNNFRLDDMDTNKNKIGIRRENILLVYLYIKSYIGSRSKQTLPYKLKEKDFPILQAQMKNINNEDSYKDSPLAFWKPIQTISTELGMSKKTLDECLDYLTQDSKNHTALLVKHKTGYIPRSDKQPPKQAPNIYVLNQKGYQNEIKWAVNKMMQIYNINAFVDKDGSKNDENDDFN